MSLTTDGEKKRMFDLFKQNFQSFQREREREKKVMKKVREISERKGETTKPTQNVKRNKKTTCKRNLLKMTSLSCIDVSKQKVTTTNP